MYSELEICYCGFSNENHKFRHKFEGFTIYKNNDENCYELNAEDFKNYQDIICQIPNCRYSKNIHGTDIVNHDFKPKKNNYRKINFAVPETTICNKKDCNISLINHGDDLTHLFCLKLRILNKNENDIVKVEHPLDEEIKIDTVFV